MSEQTQTAARTNHDTRRRIFSNLLDTMRAGYWFCNSCDARRDIIESDHGQPNVCAVCRSTNLTQIASVNL